MDRLDVSKIMCRTLDAYDSYGLLENTDYESIVVVGILDTGICSDHRSFHEVGRIPSISTDELVSDGFLEAIEELERMAREPADVLETCSIN
ncbi:hypothetical protein ACLOJK_019766 [Asimina triloba]